MRDRTMMVGLLWALLASGVAAAPILDPAHIHEKTLPNGLRVIVKSERQWPVVALGLVIKAGSGYETENNSGVAHMVEHLLFEERDSKDGLGPWIENMGGYINGTATRDFVEVTLAASSEYLDQMLPRLAAGVFAAEFTEDAVARQRRIIRRELADRIASTTDLISMFTWRLAFTEHPYGRPVPGSPEQVDELDIYEVHAFYRKFYRPDNAGLIAVGDVDPDEFFELAEQAFGGYTSLPTAVAEVPPEPPQTEVRTRIEPLEKSVTLLQFAWHAPGIADRSEVCAMDLIYMIMDDRLSRLAEAPQDGKRLLSGAVVDYLTQRWPGLFIITAVTEPAHELDLRAAILAKVERLGAAPVSSEVLQAAQQHIYAQYAFTNEAYTDQVESLAFYEGIDSYQFAVYYIDSINQVTPEDVQRTATKYLRSDNYNLVVLRPKSDERGQQKARLP